MLACTGSMESNPSMLAYAGSMESNPYMLPSTTFCRLILEGSGRMDCHVHAARPSDNDDRIRSILKGTKNSLFVFVCYVDFFWKLVEKNYIIFHTKI
jgi:hypothetical protein